MQTHIRNYIFFLDPNCSKPVNGPPDNKELQVKKITPVNEHFLTKENFSKFRTKLDNRWVPSSSERGFLEQGGC